MAWTQAEYDALKAAIARGVQTVSYNNRTVTYHDLESMRELLAEMERDLAGQAGSAYPYRLAATSKGLR
jgi:hypothetical protein